MVAAANEMSRSDDPPTAEAISGSVMARHPLGNSHTANELRPSLLQICRVYMGRSRDRIRQREFTFYPYSFIPLFGLPDIGHVSSMKSSEDCSEG